MLLVRNHMENIKKMDERTAEVFQVLVADYIANANPVASGSLSKQIHRKLSSATIRNVLADLEEMGFLSQPHTSAGRIPTEKGLRFYVDTLLKQRSLTEEEQSAIREKYDLNERGVNSVMQRTSKILAGISQYVGLVVTPSWESMEFKYMEFIPLSQGKLLGIFVTKSGMVENRVIDVPYELNNLDIEKINNYCNAAFLGLTLDEARQKVRRELQSAQNQYDRLISRALLLSEKVLGNIGGFEIYVEGGAHLLSSPEFSEVEQIRELMSLLEEKQALLEVLTAAADGTGVKVFIGSELPNHKNRNVSFIASPYRRNGQILGMLGIIGPTRMDYSRVVPIVDFTAKLVGDLL